MIKITDIDTTIECYYATLPLDFYKIACFSHIVFPDRSEWFGDVHVTLWLRKHNLTLGCLEVAGVQIFLRDIAGSL